MAHFNYSHFEIKLICLFIEVFLEGNEGLYSQQQKNVNIVYPFLVINEKNKPKATYQFDNFWKLFAYSTGTIIL